jgi:hypothetical protein
MEDSDEPAKTSIKRAASSKVGGNLITENDVQGVSMFKLCIRGEHQDLAHLIMDNGFEFMNAMQDAMDEKKFLLFLGLLTTNSAKI